jgi:hypothetical protein
MMKTIEVNSSMVSAIGYDDQSSELELTFNNGSTYRYRNVPKQAWSELQVAPSVGQYLRARIIGKYPDYQV